MPGWGADPVCGTGLSTLPTTYEKVELTAVVSSHDVRRRLQVPRHRIVLALSVRRMSLWRCRRFGLSVSHAWALAGHQVRGALGQRAAHTDDAAALQGPGAMAFQSGHVAVAKLTVTPHPQPSSDTTAEAALWPVVQRTPTSRWLPLQRPRAATCSLWPN